MPQIVIVKKERWDFIKEVTINVILVFVAAFLAFYLEQLREDSTEKDKAAQLGVSLYRELKADSAEVRRILIQRCKKDAYMDSLVVYIRREDLKKLPRKFYPAFAALYSQNVYYFQPNDGVLSQLQYSTLLRQFSNELHESIGGLNVKIKNVRIRNEQEYQFYSDPVKPFLARHFDFHFLDLLKPFDSAYTLPYITEKYAQNCCIDEIKSPILDLKHFDKDEACNLIEFNIVMMRATNTLQLKEYVEKNREVLRLLRHEYGEEIDADAKAEAKEHDTKPKEPAGH
jgi:hypothetical protein